MSRRRLNFAAIRLRNDALAWRAIHARDYPQTEPRGLKRSGRPANYPELGEAIAVGQDRSYAFAHFLDEFYLFRRASFFAAEPPKESPVKYRVFLAAVAEYLSHEFGLPVPEWTEKPEYFLSEEWDWVADDASFPEALKNRIDRRRERATPEFRRRNILYEGRNLIRL
jgi:hypothetical protein